ncbi:MAG: signal peptidase I [Calditrichaeota bacterium]|nr:MAG: signal peptidase I [Calditrichota bacterium]
MAKQRKQSKPAPSRRENTPTPKQKRQELVKATLIALAAALVLRQFVIASYNVPTGSMKDTILIGDFMFVNKFVYGAQTPSWIGIPFTCTGFQVPFLRFPAIVEPEPGEIVVFEYPLNPCQNYIKRCIAAGGQQVEVRGDTVWIDNHLEGKMEVLSRKYDMNEITPYGPLQVQYTRITRPDGKTYVLRHYVKTDSRFKNLIPLSRIKRYRITDEVLQRLHQAGIPRTMLQPLETLKGRFIVGEEYFRFQLRKLYGLEPDQPDARFDRNWVYISKFSEVNDPVIVPPDHFFMMGDNRDNSLDSRAWGFVSRDQIVGKPLVIWFSWNSHGRGIFDKVRWERLGSIVR